MSDEGLRDLVNTPPGPALAALLEALDPHTLTAEQAIPVLQAWSRQRAHDHARMAATLTRVATLSRHATTTRTAGHRSRMPAGDWADAEIAAALTWSDSKAARELDFAETLTDLPQVAAAFDQGRIDHGKAWVFTDILGPAELTPEQVHTLCAAFVPAAPGLTAGQLRHRLARAILTIDPDAAARRYRRAVTTRAVIGYLAADGTAIIAASGLPADQAAAACARVDHLAERLRRAGHPATITQIRADVFLRLLDGRLTGLTTPEIITTLLTDTATAAPPAAAPTAPTAPTAPAESGTSHPTTCDNPTPDIPNPDNPTPAGDPVPRPTGIEIRVGLATLIGLDHRPGEIPGWGPVLPHTARDLLTRHHRAPWRFAILDDDGYLLLAGTTRRRPTPAHPDVLSPQQAQGGIVELHITATLLTTLAHDPTEHPEWAEVITDLARRYTDRHRLLAALDAHPHSRHAHGPLLRHIQIRDRTCTAPGCRRPARACDTDHTRDYAHGGPTTTANTGPLCPRHHALKHHAGWHLQQPRPGRFQWTSPLGQHYTTRGEPIMPPLPQPPTPPPTPTAGPPPTATRDIDGPTFQTKSPQPRPADTAPPPRRSFWTHRTPQNPDDPAPF